VSSLVLAGLAKALSMLACLVMTTACGSDEAGELDTRSLEGCAGS